MTTALRPARSLGRPRARRTGPAAAPYRPDPMDRTEVGGSAADGPTPVGPRGSAQPTPARPGLPPPSLPAVAAGSLGEEGAVGVDVVRPVEAAVIPEGQDGPDEPAAVPVRRRLALSPSRAADFKQCPLLYRLRAIDRLAEPPSAPAVRGTLVHAVLEGLFARPASERSRAVAVAAVRPAWTTLVEQRPEVVDVVPETEQDTWLASAEALVDTYFTLEDPSRLTPEACELGLDVVVDEGLPLRGFLDRVDVSSTGLLRVVDYKTGRSPSPDFEASALYQLKFYALMIYRSRGIVPAQLKLIYLGDGVTLTYTTSERELLAFEQSVRALWSAMTAAVRSGEFPATPGRGCTWCTHRAVCPAYDGTPPDYPAPLVPELLPPAAEPPSAPPLS